jgi:hypothetical protein
LDLCVAALREIEANPCGIAFVVVYRLAPLQSRLVRVAARGVGEAAAPATMSLDATAGWPIAEVLRSRGAVMLREHDSLADASCTIGGSEAAAAVLLPLYPVPDEAGGVMIVGLNGTIAFDDASRMFTEMLAGMVAAGIAHATLRHNRTVFQTFSDQAPAAVFIKDVNGAYLFDQPLPPPDFGLPEPETEGSDATPGQPQSEAEQDPAKALEEAIKRAAE